MIRALILRELRLALRQAGGTSLSLAFMALFVLLCGLALGGDSIGTSADNGPLGIGLLWLAVTLSILLGLDSLYQTDQRQGVLAQLYLAGVSSVALAAAKMLVFALIYILPLIAIVPLLAPLMGLNTDQMSGVVISLLFGMPGLTAYASFTAALLAAQRGNGLLGVLLTAPLLVPLLIFGVDAAQAWPVSGFAAVQFRILAGLSLIGIAVGGLGTVAAIAANRGPG
jgi:heme exporter protein B